MKEKLELQIDAKLLVEARKVTKLHGTSVEKLCEDFLTNLFDKSKGNPSK